MLQAFEILAKANDVGVIRAQQALGHRDGLPVQRIGGGVATLLVCHQPQAMQAQGNIGMRVTKKRLRCRQRFVVERLGLVVVALLAAHFGQPQQGLADGRVLVLIELPTHGEGFAVKRLGRFEVVAEMPKLDQRRARHFFSVSPFFRNDFEQPATHFLDTQRPFTPALDPFGGADVPMGASA